MRMDDGVHIRPRAVDLAVDEALEEMRDARRRADRLAVEIVLDDVGGGDEGRGEVAPEQIAAGIRGVAKADMAIGVEHALVDQNAVRRDEVFGHVGRLRVFPEVGGSIAADVTISPRPAKRCRALLKLKFMGLSGWSYGFSAGLSAGRP